MEACAGQASSAHIVLVHGACLGGWSWFKVATRLRSAGHRVSTPDLAASGVDRRPLREVPTFRDYTKPLLDLMGSLPPGEKFVEGRTLDWMDTEFKPQDPEGKLPTSMLFGPLVTRAKFFQLCSPEDLTLGRSLMRVSSMFVDDLRLQPPHTEARYGSVRKAYVVFKDDHAIVGAFQRWMVHNYPVDEVMEIDGADHMALLSTPTELARCLAHIAVNMFQRLLLHPILETDDAYTDRGACNLVTEQYTPYKVGTSICLEHLNLLGDGPVKDGGDVTYECVRPVYAPDPKVYLNHFCTSPVLHVRSAPILKGYVYTPSGFMLCPNRCNSI
ncbi:hypothetical protein TRIUR3_27782 [Triticum urartu]|uniref:AB hydrolase-1 domain-containing protein n=1 Tax=Triticum urartu TaxID=4572 RepID=M8ANC4_TRIUA|nr:hypothetical protein TRIUR3_27782 [Triticum urartu]